MLQRHITKDFRMEAETSIFPKVFMATIVNFDGIRENKSTKRRNLLKTMLISSGSRFCAHNGPDDKMLASILITAAK